MFETILTVLFVIGAIFLALFAVYILVLVGFALNGACRNYKYYRRKR